MPFGPQQALACFSYIMDVALHGVQGARAYLDDLKALGASWQACWEATMRALRVLTGAWFKVNLCVPMAYRQLLQGVQCQSPA